MLNSFMVKQERLLDFNTKAFFGIVSGYVLPMEKFGSLLLVITTLILQHGGESEMLLLRDSLLCAKKSFLCHYLYSCGGFTRFWIASAILHIEHCACLYSMKKWRHEGRSFLV